MHTVARTFVVLAAALLAAATALGAWAAHGLERLLTPDAIATFRTGVEYHFYHAIALLGIAALLDRTGGNRGLALAGWLLVVGIALFSGSLYLLAFDGPRFLGPVTPLGGLCFIAGWLMLAFAALRLR